MIVGPTYNSKIDVLQHQVRLRSILCSIITKLIQRNESLDVRYLRLHKLDLPDRRPILGFRFGDLVRGFRLQFHIMENPLDASHVLLNIASRSHNPILENQTK